MSDIAGEVERVLGEHEYGIGPVLGGAPMICRCGAARKPDHDEPLQDVHRAHQAQQIAAHLARNDLTAFLAELPADVFSERDAGLIREWADEWRAGGGEG